MGGSLYKSTKIFDNVIVMLTLWYHQNATAKKVERFRGYLRNTSRKVQLISMSFLGKHL